MFLSAFFFFAHGILASVLGFSWRFAFMLILCALIVSFGLYRHFLEPKISVTGPGGTQSFLRTRLLLLISDKHHGIVSSLCLFQNNQSALDSVDYMWVSQKKPTYKGRLPTMQQTTISASSAASSSTSVIPPIAPQPFLNP
jgi:hypothetical protein